MFQRANLAYVPTYIDAAGLPCKEKWDYAIVVGMLMFVANNTRPDIAFSTHQVARFSFYSQSQKLTRRSGEHALISQYGFHGGLLH